MSDSVDTFFIVLRSAFLGFAIAGVWDGYYRLAATAFLLAVACEFALRDAERNFYERA